jgi:hypothetical protein
VVGVDVEGVSTSRESWDRPGGAVEEDEEEEEVTVSGLGERDSAEGESRGVDRLVSSAGAVEVVTSTGKGADLPVKIRARSSESKKKTRVPWERSNRVASTRVSRAEMVYEKRKSERR